MLAKYYRSHGVFIFIQRESSWIAMVEGATGHG